MLNETQKNLLNDYINDHFIETTKNFIQHAETADEELKNIDMVKKALSTEPNLDFCNLLLSTYPTNQAYNQQKIALLLTLSGVVNGQMKQFKYTQTLLDPHLSIKPSELTEAEWVNTQKKLIGEYVCGKMQSWIGGLEKKSSKDRKHLEEKPKTFSR